MMFRSKHWPALALVFTAACSDPAPPQEPEAAAEPEITNRVHVSADVIANLGITFDKVRRERLRTWLTVPGQLEVPDDHRWTVRAPAAGRVAVERPRWAEVEVGGRVGEILSPELLATQQALLEAEQAQRRSTPYLEAGRARLEESEEHLAMAQQAEASALERFDEVRRLSEGSTLSNRELVTVQRELVAAQAATLDAALRRDDLSMRAGTLELQRDQADLAFGQKLRALSVLTGQSEASLAGDDNGRAAWRGLTSIELRSPGRGRIVDVFASTGERVDVGAPVVDVIDVTELVFRGQVPEGDLGRIPAEARVVVEPATGKLQPIETRLIGSLPVANEVARTVRVEARVPNPERRLPHGLSAVARVLLSESAQEENVIPLDCVVMDGLDAIVFVRDAAEPDEVIRTPVALGRRDHDSVEVLSGVLAGDEVVRDGALQLKEASSSQATASGHFHADGTFHGEHK